MDVMDGWIGVMDVADNKTEFHLIDRIEVKKQD